MERNLADALRQHARSRPDHPALIDGDRRIDHRELDALVDRAAQGLLARGCTPGDTVGLSMRDHWGHVVAMWACMRAGLVLLPLDCRWTDTERQAVVGHFGATQVVRDPDARVEELPSIDWTDLLRDAALTPPVAWPEVDLDSPLLLSLSSGTTGRPKGPRITHRHFLRRFMTHWIDLGLNAASRYVCATPLYFGGGRTFTLSVLFSGGTVIMRAPPFEPAELADAVRTHDANALFLVPTQLRRLLRAPAAEREAFARLRLLISSGAPLQPNERLAILDSLCPNFHEYYASTEGGGVSLCTPQDFRRRPASVGRAIFGVEIGIVDDAGRALPAGRVGSLRYRGPGVADGFFADPDQSALHFRDGWFLPGDLAEIDAEGYVHLRGRSKDMIIRGGVNIYPNEIEDVLLQLPQMQECAVLGVPDADLGETVACAWVAQHPFTVEALVAHCRRQLSPYKVPSRWLRLDELPVNSGGKVVKARLRALFESG
ncbi:MAG: class I adenylate-forming enzyme family protein [Lautropia sp.]